MTPLNSTRERLKKQLLDILKQSAGSLVIASAILAPPPAKAAVDPQSEQAVSARVEKIQDQIGQRQTNTDGPPQIMGSWHNWFNLPVWSNWSDWNNKQRWYNWGDWGNHKRHKWHNWGNWFNH